MDIRNLETIRESYGRVVYTHKTHEKDADLKEKHALIIKIINIILTSLTSGALISTFITNQLSLNIASAVFSTLMLFFSIFQLSFNPEKEAEKHRLTARDLWKVREEYVNLMVDLVNSKKTDEEIIKKRDGLINKLDIIYRNAPPTSNKAYEIARKSLKVDEEMTFSEKEIDNFLPKNLKMENIKTK